MLDKNAAYIVRKMTWKLTNGVSKYYEEDKSGSPT